MTPKQQAYLLKLIARHQTKANVRVDAVTLASEYRDWLTPTTRRLWDTSTGETRGRLAAWIVAEVAGALERVHALVVEQRLTKVTAGMWIDQLSGERVIMNGILHLTAADAAKRGQAALPTPVPMVAEAVAA